jgi:hypothetical protein
MKPTIASIVIVFFLTACAPSNTATVPVPGNTSGALALIEITTNEFCWSGIRMGPYRTQMRKSQLEAVVGPFEVTATTGFHMEYCNGYSHGDVIHNGYALHVSYLADAADPLVDSINIILPKQKQDRTLDEIKADFEQRFVGAWHGYDEKDEKHAYFVVDGNVIYLKADRIALFLARPDF